MWPQFLNWGLRLLQPGGLEFCLFFLISSDRIEITAATNSSIERYVTRMNDWPTAQTTDTRID